MNRFRIQKRLGDRETEYWWVGTPGGPFDSYILVCETFHDAIHCMDAWIRGVKRGIPPDELFKISMTQISRKSFILGRIFSAR